MLNTTTIACDHQAADGDRCGALAVVHNIHFVYSADRPARGTMPIAAECQIECPVCGPRLQVVKFDRPADGK
jgi:hypothetical protein